MSISIDQQKKILEAAIMIADRPLSAADLQKLFDEKEEISTKQIRELLNEISEKYTDSGIELNEVSSGFRFQARTELSPWLSKLWEERAPRFSRALLETLALIAYRQPITRAEIEEIRGVVVSSNIIKTLQDREWIRIVGYKEAPGKPALFATTKTFLDDLNLKNLSELPPLSEIIDLEKQEQKLQVQLELQAEQTSSNELAEIDEADEISEIENPSISPNSETVEASEIVETEISEVIDTEISDVTETEVSEVIETKE